MRGLRIYLNNTNNYILSGRAVLKSESSSSCTVPRLKIVGVTLPCIYNAVKIVGVTFPCIYNAVIHIH